MLIINCPILSSTKERLALSLVVPNRRSIELTTAYYFGTSVDGSCNINWVLYHPGANGMWTPLAWRFSGTSGVCYGFLPSVGRDERLPPERHGASIETSAARQAVHQISSWGRTIGTPPPPPEKEEKELKNKNHVENANKAKQGMDK